MSPPDAPDLIRGIWPRHRHRIILALFIGHALLGLALTGILTLLGMPMDAQALIIISCIVSSLLITSIISMAVARPLKTLLAALSHVSAEPSTLTPPNPNSSVATHDGLKPALEGIYSLSTNNPGIAEGSSAIATYMPQAFDRLASGVVFLDETGRITYASKGVPIRQDQQNQPTLELLFEGSDTLEHWIADCTDAINATHIWERVPNRIIGEEGRRVFDIVASYQKSSPAAFVLMLFDRSAKYQPEDDDLDFIAFAAHELRGPITVIRGYLDVLYTELQSTLKDDQHELFDRLSISANRLSGYINNILNVSRYDRRHFNVHIGQESLATIYDIVHDDMAMRANAQHRLLAIDISPDLPTVAADRGSISEVFSNLIDNAIKYSFEGGSVTVSAHQQGDFVEVTITDTGIGIPASVMGNLFHKFYRSHRSRELVSGTGIGLYLCKAIIESHGGTIGVQSQEGKGSTFTFTLPIYAAVADKLRTSDSSTNLLKSNQGWIKNHTMFKG